MSEVEALLALYGAIDRAVVAGEASSADLAPLLGAYRDGRAVGWYDQQYLPWAEARSGRKSKRKPSGHSPVTHIRDCLRAFPVTTVEGRPAARRLLAATVAARAMPQHFSPGGTHMDAAAKALPFGGGTPLHERFVDQFTSMSDWPRVVESAVSDGLLPKSFLNQAAAPPCTGTLIMRPDPTGKDADPCTVLESEFTTSDATFDELKRYLEPENWQYPGSFWCRMERGKSLGANTWLYHETVATSCPPESAWWTASTDLQFWFSHPTPTEARVEYDFPPGLPTELSDINIDEGSLRVIELPDGSVSVKTTKRVRFSGSMDGPGLAMLMCATGYSTIVEDLVFSIAADPTKKIEPFPVPAPQGGVVSPVPSSKKTVGKKATTAKAASANTTPGHPMSESLEDVVNEAAQHAASYFKDVADTCTASLKSIEAGTYKVENAWSDGMKLWSTYLTGLSKAIDLGRRSAQAYAQKPTNET